MSDLIVSSIDSEFVVDSRLIAERLGVTHEVWEHIVVSSLGSFKENLSPWNLLAICRNSSLIGCPVSSILTLIEETFSPMWDQSSNLTFSLLKLSVVEGLGQDALCRQSEIGRVHSWFSKNYQEIFPYSENVPVKAIDRKRPDFLLKIGNHIIPVECKLIFDKRAKTQLLNYMKCWRSVEGIAVGTRLLTSLPRNIAWIECP